MSYSIESKYPNQFDTHLVSVQDSLQTFITSEIDSKNFDNIISLSNIQNWPSAGFVTIYLPNNNLKAKQRTRLFYYGNIEGNNLLEVELIEGDSSFYFPEQSIAVQNVIAQNHNSLKNSILSLENYIGIKNETNEKTLSWFVDYLIKNVYRPIAFLDVSIKEAFPKDEIIFFDKTTRIDIENDKSLIWTFRPGDNTIYIVKRDEDDDFLITKTTYFKDSKTEETIYKNSSWDRTITHKYLNHGNYDINLHVKSNYGKDEILLKRYIKIHDTSIVDLNIDVKSKNYIGNVHRLYASKDSVKLKATPKYNSFDDPVSITQYIWDFGRNVDKNQLLNSPILEVYFAYGGMYNVGLKMVSETGSWAYKKLNNIINVIEKPSVWLSYNELTSNNFIINEYSIFAKSWKEMDKKPSFIMEKDFSVLQTKDYQNDINFLNDGGFHNKLNSSEVFILWSSNKETIKNTSYDIFLDTYKSIQDYNKNFNWYSVYIPEVFSKRLYILGGVESIENYSKMNQDITYYDMDSETYKKDAVGNLYVDPSNSTDSNNLSTGNVTYIRTPGLVNNPKSVPAKWRAASYRSQAYIFRNSDNGIFDVFVRFDPTASSFAIESSSVPFSKEEISMSASYTGIYVLNNSGDFYKYDTATKSWSSSSSFSTEQYKNLFHTEAGSNNDKLRIISGTECRTINASNNIIYFSADYTNDNFGAFDTLTSTISKLSSRPITEYSLTPRQFAMGVI